MPDHAADRLLEKIDRLAAPVCVGIDPVLERLPRVLHPGDASAAPAQRAVAMIRGFALGVLDAVVEHVPCVKLQSACFERYGAAGVAALADTVAAARRLGLEVILDAKRGDIGISAEHYAAAAFGAEATGPSAPGDADGASRADWITVSAYLGPDGLVPFLRPGHGAFALVRTSNPGGDALQTRPLADGRTVAEAVAAMVADVGAGAVGARGYSALGAVVGATRPDDVARLREIMPRQIFLVPGYGAQGAGVDEVRHAFAGEGGGAIVTASRSIIYAGDPADSNWTRSVGDAARRFADEVGRGVGVR